MPEDSEDKAAEQPKKGKGMLIVGVLAFIALLCVGVVLYLFVFKKTAPVANAGEGAAASAGASHSAPAGTVMSEVQSLFTDTFLVNLADPGGSRYLKITLSIEGTEQVDPKKKKAASGGHAGAGAESPDNPKIKDTVITILSSKTFQEISNPQGKIALKQELQRRLNSFLNPHIQVTNIYITEFVVQ